jgi:1-deoxy-D-xylulose-5-phosphate reductoisomerase
MDGTKSITLLGSTGSIGRSTLDVVRRHPGRFSVKALAAGSNTPLVTEQAEEFKPDFVSVLTEEGAREVKRSVGPGVEVGFGPEGAERAATYEGSEMTVSAIVGAAGLLPTMAAIKAGRDIALANKETLVAAGPIVMEEVEKSGSRLLPVDSEHSAVFQALEGQGGAEVSRIILTASGGPFLTLPLDRLDDRLDAVTPEDALAHPRWVMGRRISVDSATLMNKGFEVIEARWLFDVPEERISVCIHPQSVVHSMVEYIDGSIIAQMGASDMRGPIAYALSYPERIESGVERFTFPGTSLEFIEPDRAGPGEVPRARTRSRRAPCRGGCGGGFERRRRGRGREFPGGSHPIYRHLPDRPRGARDANPGKSGYN